MSWICEDCHREPCFCHEINRIDETIKELSRLQSENEILKKENDDLRKCLHEERVAYQAAVGVGGLLANKTRQ